MMLDSNPEPYISDMAKTNSEVAKDADMRKENKNYFFYMLGYFNGQDSILDKKRNLRNDEQSRHPVE